MKDIYDISKSDVDYFMSLTRESLEVPAIITIVIDEHGEFTVHCAAGVDDIKVCNSFKEGPPGLRGYEALKKYLTAAADVIDKCIREGSYNFNMKP